MKTKYLLTIPILALLITHSPLIHAQRSFDIKVDYATGANPRSIAIGDLNDDGKADLAVANFSSNTISIYTNTGTGSFGAKTDYGVGSSPKGIAIGDLNGDGKLDLAIVNSSSNSISIFTNTGTGSFGTKIDYSTGNVPIAVAIGDLNNDGLNDFGGSKLWKCFHIWKRNICLLE